MLSPWHRYELRVGGRADVAGYSTHCPVNGDISVVVTIVGRQRSRREALESIEILPLRSIIAKLEQTYPGQIIEAALERDDCLWINEIKPVRKTACSWRAHKDNARRRPAKIPLVAIGR